MNESNNQPKSESTDEKGLTIEQLLEIQTYPPYWQGSSN